ncbi:MAG: hemin uptake protein HemP [Paracoccus sp. (in: a-proteobacteria)]|nr:hemin uptake protein HemP [Paracoccus sp. (in: a-proteobacteria)]
MTAIHPADFARAASQIPQLPLHDAVSLTQGGNQALIALNDQVYHLRITRAGKLILTK